MTTKAEFSRREREVMDILFRRGQATAVEVMEAMADPPSYSAVRSTMSILEGKGHLTHERDGGRYVYRPTTDPNDARRSALEHLLETFFDGSAAAVVSALLEERRDDLSKNELDRLSKLIQQARKEGR